MSVESAIVVDNDEVSGISSGSDSIDDVVSEVNGDEKGVVASSEGNGMIVLNSS